MKAAGVRGPISCARCLTEGADVRRSTYCDAAQWEYRSDVARGLQEKEQLWQKVVLVMLLEEGRMNRKKDRLGSRRSLLLGKLI